MGYSSFQYQITRRKTAIAKIELYSGCGDIFINNKSINIYFLNNCLLLQKIKQFLKLIPFDQMLSNIFIFTQGGGLESQLNAILLGLSKLLALKFPFFEPKLQQFGFLTSDLRVKERKKYGLRKARKAPQYSKR